MTKRTDWHELNKGDRVLLHPRKYNPLHSSPSEAYFDGVNFWGKNPEDGPDYYLGDVHRYNSGFEVIDEDQKDSE